MVENSNASKNPGTGDFVDIKKYVGVASLSILAINPNNSTLRKYGWNIAEDANEPNYTSTQEKNGKMVKVARVRFLCMINDLDEKPIVSLDFWCREGKLLNKDASKCKIIDVFGRTAWATKEEMTKGSIPMYASGPANVSTPYKPCHPGEEELILFISRFLNITPLTRFDRLKKEYVNNDNPGKITIDDWNAIINGNIKELASDIAIQPDNKLKVILGVRTTEENKTYQTFLNTGYISNGSRPDITNNEYPAAKRLIDKFNEGHDDSSYIISAEPVHEYKESATDVKETSVEDMPSFGDDEGDDLPFGD